MRLDLRPRLGQRLEGGAVGRPFLREGSTYGPSETRGTPEDFLRPASDEYPGTLSAGGRCPSTPTVVGVLRAFLSVEGLPFPLRTLVLQCPSAQ